MFAKFVLLAVMLDYNALLPKEKLATTGTEAIRHVLRKHRAEVNRCASLVNTKEKHFKIETVCVQTGTVIFRIRKAKHAEADVQHHRRMDNVVEGCIVDLLKSPKFKAEWDEETIDGNVAVDIDCQVDIQRHTFSRDDLSAQCQAAWNYYPLDEDFPVKASSAWK